MSPMIVMPLAWGGCTWDDQPLFYDALPGLYPPISKIDPRRGEGRPERTAFFEVRFYPDRIEKGSAGRASVYRYEDVFDVVEDGCFPDLAIVRIDDAASEIVVRPSALAGASWAEVKERIREKSGRVALREALFGKRKGKEGR